MSRIKKGVIRSLNLSASGAGVAENVSNYEFVTFQLATTGSASGTLKMAVSLSTIKPDFTVPPSATNIYDYVELVPVANPASPIVGTTGIVLAGTDKIALYTIQVAGYFRWICPILTWTAGVWVVDIDAANNTSRG